jgi:two-component system OmpR family response regulator
LKVLVIDDNNEITEAVTLFLEARDISCTVANTGKEGLAAIKREDFDIIFLDLAMPEFSGYDVFQQLKKEGLVEKKNIVIFTASSINEQDAESLVNEGAKALLRKPFPVDELEALLDRFQKH